MSYDTYQDYRAEHLEQLLQSGERILWQGKPVRAKFMWRKWPRSCFGAVFLGFALFWTGMALSMTSAARSEGADVPAFFSYVFPLFGLPFILVGAGLTFGHFIHDKMAWRNTEYALTDQRVLIRSGARTPTVSSTELADVTGVTFKGDAIGSVSFGTAGTSPSVGGFRRFGDYGPSVRAAPTFECIPRPEEVYRIAEDALHRLRREGE
jgi:hypothetical protein